MPKEIVKDGGTLPGNIGIPSLPTMHPSNKENVEKDHTNSNTTAEPQHMIMDLADTEEADTTSRTKEPLVVEKDEDIGHLLEYSEQDDIISCVENKKYGSISEEEKDIILARKKHIEGFLGNGVGNW